MKVIIALMVALFGVAASAAAQTGPCKYQGPNGGAMETRAIGTTIQGFNAIGSSGFDTGQGFRIGQLRSWGWTVEWEFVSHAGRTTAAANGQRVADYTDRLFIVAVCAGLAGEISPPPGPVTGNFGTCDTTTNTTFNVEFNPELIAHGSTALGYMLALTGPDPAQPSQTTTVYEDLGKPTLDATGCARVPSAIVQIVSAQSTTRTYSGTVRGCDLSKSAGPTLPGPIGSYGQCGDWSSPATLNTGALGASVLRFTATTQPRGVSETSESRGFTGTLRAKIEFVRWAPKTRVNGIVASTATKTFNCTPMVGAAVVAQPTLNPQTLIFGKDQYTECRTSIADTVKILPESAYQVRIKSDGGATLADTSNQQVSPGLFTVKR